MKYASPDMLDASLSLVRMYADTMVVCSGQPKDYADAVGPLMIGSIAMSEKHYNGPRQGAFAMRMLTVLRRTEVPVEKTSTADHIALCDSTSGRLLYVTTCYPQSVVKGNTMTVPEWDIEIGDPE